MRCAAQACARRVPETGRRKPVRTVRGSALCRAQLTPLGRWAAGPLGRWAAGPLGRWAAGPLGRWAAGPLGRWAAGPLGRWAAGPLGRWAAGPLGRWAAGPLGRWAAGPLGRWAAGPLGRWAAGPLGRWAAGPLALYPTPCRDWMSSAISSAGRERRDQRAAPQESFPTLGPRRRTTTRLTLPAWLSLSTIVRAAYRRVPHSCSRTGFPPTDATGTVRAQPVAAAKRPSFSGRSISALHPNNHEVIVNIRF